MYIAILVVGTSAGVAIETESRIRRRREIIGKKPCEKRGITFINQYVIILLFLPFENR